MPVIISRDDRKDYIECLESADNGDLNPFVEFIVRLETRMIMSALGESEPIADSVLVSQVLKHITDRVKRQRQDRLDQMRLVNNVASDLRDIAKAYLETQASSVCYRLNEAGLPVDCPIDCGGPDGREHWYRAQVVRTASDAGYWANLNEQRFFIKLSVNPQGPSRNPRLVFVVSLHHVGRQLTGIMTATAFAQIVNVQDYGTEGTEEPADPDFINCTKAPLAPFTFTCDDDAESVARRFTSWIDKPLAIALSHWGEFI